jgi:hypothetical protein
MPVQGVDLADGRFGDAGEDDTSIGRLAVDAVDGEDG